MQKRFDDLTITDDYMFCAVMQDKSICTTVLNMVLADAIGPISDITYQKTFDQVGYAKSIRLDVWVTGSNGNVYDVEMQTTNKQDLAKRLRYYQSVIDVSSLEKGGHYTDLPDSFIIFFCPFDYLNSGLPVYTFKHPCAAAVIVPTRCLQTVVAAVVNRALPVSYNRHRTKRRGRS